MRLASRLWPLNRSLTGEGLRLSLDILAEELPGLALHSIESGTSVFDWTVPQQWEAREAYIVTPSGEKICDFQENNLHLVGYSVPFKGELTLNELESHLHTLPMQPTAIPYVTSYYSETWGFCLSQAQRDKLVPGTYKVVVDTDLFQGVLNYGEFFIQGRTSREIVFSTYVCHPSMANNELSGPVLAVELARLLRSMDSYYSYRFLFLPETIGSLVYLSRNLDKLKKNTLAGFILTCVGDDRDYSFMPSRSGDTVADRVALQTLKNLKLEFTHYTWFQRGSDERQFCSPGADLPFCSIMRSKYGTYPEYHTSLDKLDDVVTADGLNGSFRVYETVIRTIENLRFPSALQIGEPQLGKRGLYPNISKKGSYEDVSDLMDVLSLSDGTLSLEEICEALELDRETLCALIGMLESHKLIAL